MNLVQGKVLKAHQDNGKRQRREQGTEAGQKLPYGTANPMVSRRRLVNLVNWDVMTSLTFADLYLHDCLLR